MPKRTQTYIKAPWTGGVNTSVDPGFLNDNDVVKAENVVFAATGSRLKREGFSYVDTSIPTPDLKSSSGTTRTIKWTSNDIQTASDNILVVGERISITGDSDFNTTGTTVSSITTTSTYQLITYELATSESITETSVGNLSIKKASSVLNVLDFWYTNTTSNQQVQALLAMDSWGKLFTYTSDNERSEVEAGASATVPTTELSQVTSLVFNNRAIFTYDVVGDKPIKYNPQDAATFELLGGSPPDFSLMAPYLARLWTNDKTDPHRVHYSSTGNHEEWNGVGDSGAIDINPGDGDPEGIKAIIPFNRELYIAKKNALYVVQGDSPENFSVRPVTKGVGAESPFYAPAGESDVFFITKRGVQTLISSQQGASEADKFVSSKIQPTFNAFELERLKYTQAAYYPELNSVAFTFANNSSTENEIWLYNFQTQGWYTWPDLSCTSLSRRQVGNEQKPVWGTNNGRIVQAQNNTFTDFESDGIDYLVKTGTIYPSGDAVTLKAFKKIGFLYKPLGNFSFTVKIKIDNLPTQSYLFEQDAATDLLGSTFTLGSSVLGVDSVLSPYSVSIDGIGRGLSFTVEQSGTGEQVEIYGFIVEWEPADIRQEVV